MRRNIYIPQWSRHFYFLEISLKQHRNPSEVMRRSVFNLIFYWVIKVTRELL